MGSAASKHGKLIKVIMTLTTTLLTAKLTRRQSLITNAFWSFNL